MEADDLGTYVVKFSGAGQGRKALIAEVVCAGLATALGLPVPRLVTFVVDPVLAAN
ncbi:MAG TPA: HipA family kinase [Jatrophihabitantaceae bacterium]|nr:HipA family kinase [Jatrophihabitantaceae bacterium]